VALVAAKWSGDIDAGELQERSIVETASGGGSGIVFGPACLTAGSVRNSFSKSCQYCNTKITLLIAAIVALLVFRRVTIYPGAKAFEFILPAFSTTFGVAAAVLLVSRISYGGSMLIAGYLASVGVTFLPGNFNQHAEPQRMYCVPAGKTGIVDDAPYVDWVRMIEPVVPNDLHAAIVVDHRGRHQPVERLPK